MRYKNHYASLNSISSKEVISYFAKKIFLKYNLPIEFKELMFVIHGVVLSSSCENTKFQIEP